EFRAMGGRDTLSPNEAKTLIALEGKQRVDHGGVRWLKMRVLRRCFECFESLPKDHPRKQAFLRFEAEESSWLETYAIFRALKEVYPQSWRVWPPEIRLPQPRAISAFTSTHSAEIRFRKYVQFLAFSQLRAARAALHKEKVALFGDEPFLVAEDSAEVWGRKQLFRFDATVGAPPDAFSEDGQEWGLPPYRWDRLKEQGYALFVERARHVSRLYDGVRIDHVVGLYRTYHRPIDGSPHYFFPGKEEEQLAQGEAVLQAFLSSGIEVLAEDLGVIPPFVRRSLEGLKIPGYRVFRWEKEGNRYRDPSEYPHLSVATTGTHDTETLAEWWEGLSEAEREQVLEIPSLAGIRDAPGASKRFGAFWLSEEVWQAMMRALIRSPSCAVLLPIHDVLGLRERVNRPNTLGPHNWSTRLPWVLSALAEDAIVQARMRFLEEEARAGGRANPEAESRAKA
ncbi:MAG: 4-alpha-glucanotransferase, partial [Deltaproteobacteria bacterium]|nr:4-alpha-glucanotransferase [Deltaproteobacteria bacterium]